MLYLLAESSVDGGLIAVVISAISAAGIGLSGAIKYIDNRTEKKTQGLSARLTKIETAVVKTIEHLVQMLVNETDTERKQQIAEAIKLLKVN